MELLRNKQQEPYENTKNCYICDEKFEDKYIKSKKYCKVRDYCHYTGEYRGAPKEIVQLKKFLQFFIVDLIMTISL